LKDFQGEIEIDESYFGPKKQGRRGRGTAKIPVFGILKREGKVYTQIIKHAGKSEIRPIILKLIRKGSILYSDDWSAYRGLVFNGYQHFKVSHVHHEFSKKGTQHINSIESFWAFSKRRLLKFNGIRRKDFYYYLKECEFRFNERPNLYKKILSILKIF
jgi:transposase